MSDYSENLKSDWTDFVKEVQDLVNRNPEYTIKDLIDSTGGDYEDVLWALKGR